MKTTPHLRFFVAALGGSLFAISSASADTLYWDGNDTNANANGGAGTWDNGATSNWDDAPFGGAASVWTNANNDTAVFGGTSSTGVNLSGNITVGGLQFDTTGYQINTGANTLSLGATDNIISLGSVAAAKIRGTVGGSGNLILTGNPAVGGTLTIDGTSTGGWSGTTTVSAVRTLTIDNNSGPNQSLLNTSGIILNGGSINIANVLSAHAAVNFVNDSAAITVNGGGSFTWRPINAGPTFLENIGAVTVNSGEMRFATGSISSGSATLAIPSITRSTSTANLVFSLGNNGILVDGNANKIQVAGSGTTAGWVSGDTSNSIIGAWATSGTGAGADYAVYSGNNVVSANTVASAQTNWTAADKQYTLTNATGTATDGRLTATRNVTALRNTTTATAAAATNGGAANLDYYTLAGNTFSDGDVVSVSGTNGTTAGVPYYIVNVGVNGADTFQISTTPNLVTPTLVNLGNTTAGQIAGGITLSAGNNLGTTGILNGSTTALAIGGSGGVVTLPGATSGNLFVNATAGAIGIDAPITDNGAGVLTLVKSGSNSLRLSGANTFTGGTVINAGTLQYTTDAALGASGSRNITFGGTGQLTGFNGSSLGSLTINNGALASISGNNITFASTTGAGDLRALAGNATLNLGDASTFTGSIRKDAGGNGGVVQFSALSDAAGYGNLIFGGGSGDSNQRITLRYSGTSALEFNNRRIELLPKPSNWNFRNAILENNSSNAAHTWIINTDIINQTDRNVEFTLSGSNAGNNEFTGVISDSARGTYYSTQVGQLNLYKTGTGRWIVSGDNTFTGRILVNQGTLSVDTIANAGVVSAIGAGSLIQLGGSDRYFNGNNGLFSGNNSGTLEYTGGTASSDRTFLIGDTAAGNTGGGRINNNGSGALTFTASTFNDTITGITATRTLTLGGSNTGANEVQGVIQDNVTSTGKINVVKADAGTWILGGDNTYTGSTNVNNGTLIIDGDSSLATGNVIVATTATLGGSGTVGGATTVNGFLAPGNSPGVLSFDSTLALAGTATTTIEIDGLTRGTQYDGINIAGDLTYGGTLILDFGVFFGGGTYNFDLFNIGTGESGDFNFVNLAGVYSGSLLFDSLDTWELVDGDNTWTFTQSTGDLNLTVIPEPSVALLGGLGLLVLFRRRRA